MTPVTVNTKQLFLSLDETWADLLHLIKSTDETSVNLVPFEGSWTAAQLVRHVTKSNKAIAQGLQMDGTPAKRNPEEGVAKIKDMFLDFEAKYQSPEFIVPENIHFERERINSALQKSIEQLEQNRNNVELTEMITLPIFGEVTKLELLYFVLYHTQRHNHQLRKILKALKKSK
ncbi:MAG: DinB family protein [Bacteroidota bacterium]|nr:DinB family protein [Bacteroidota bacterium]